MALLGDPASRTRTGLLLLLGYMLWTAVQLRRLERPSFGGSEFFEDTADGAPPLPGCCVSWFILSALRACARARVCVCVCVFAYEVACRCPLFQM